MQQQRVHEKSKIDNNHIHVHNHHHHLHILNQKVLKNLVLENVSKLSHFAIVCTPLSATG